MKQISKKILFVALLLFLLPLTAYLQTARNQLLSVLKTYDQLKYIEYSSTYVSLDINADTFYLENKGELLFTNYRSKTYYRLGGLNIDIFFTNKFLSKKHFILKCNTENTTLYDVENNNVRIYEKMNNQLYNTRFKVNQIILPLFLNDSSNLYNKRFFEKIIAEKPLDSKDTLLSKIYLDSNYLNKYYRFVIFFKNFDETNAIIKWGNYFDKQFICNLKDKRFIIVVDKKSLLPVEYLVLLGSSQFESYRDLSIRNKNKSKTVSFNPYRYEPFPMMLWNTSAESGEIRNSCDSKQNQLAFDFIEADCLNQKQIHLFDIKSEYILLYVWNSLSIDNSLDFQELCKLAKTHPEKLSIIGLNNYNESKAYIEKTSIQYQWKFPSIKGKEVCRKYFISEAPAFILIHKSAGNYYLSNSYIIDNSKYISLIIQP